MKGFQCESQNRFPVRSLKNPPWRLYWGLRTISQTVQYISIVFQVSPSWFNWTYFPVCSSRIYCIPWHFQGQFVQDLLCCKFLSQVLTEEKHLAKTIAVATRWTITNIEITLKVMDDQEYRTRYLTVWLNFSISGTC